MARIGTKLTTRGCRNSWPTQAKKAKNISTTTIARTWFCGKEILYEARPISLGKNSELKVVVVR
jgi:hypothetical protein